MTREEKLSRDISEIKKALQSIAKDLNYFRKKDEGSPMYTCKDCAEYQWIRIDEPNVMAHWCALHCCTISNEGLREPCSDFVKDGEFS